jgi:UDP-N-acetyl-2-amino-2-deoxyglucuronate dehydrogenase
MIINVVSLDRKICTSIAGCGRVSKKHFKSIESYANKLELVSACDTDKTYLKIWS